MKLDLTKRDESKKITFKKIWAQEQYSKLRKIFSEDEISNRELQEFILSEYEKRDKVEGRFFNNTDNSNYLMSIETFINTFLNKDLILTGYNCLFNSHNDVQNICSDALEYLLKTRKKYKKQMESAEYGSDEYIYYRVLQLTFKVLANSFYGILGEKNSIFYNPFVQNSITLSGQDLITTSIVTMECFLDNNFKFPDLDSMIAYIDNILREQENFNISGYIKLKTKEEIVSYLKSKVPEYVKEDEILFVIRNLSIEELNRIYWKNNFREILKEEYFFNKIKKISSYEYTTEVNENIKEDLESLKNEVLDFCFYNNLMFDKYMTALNGKRDVVCTIDTDSNFININGILNDYKENFKEKEFSEVENMTLVNIFINITTEVLKRIFWLLTGNFGIAEEIRPKINMKNEFVYKRLLLTRNKKSYGGIITSELGRILKEPQLDIKGLSIRKTTLSKKLRNELTNLLEFDILRPDKVNITKILDNFDKIEKDVKESLKKGSMEFSLPKNIELISNYKFPSKLEAVRGAIIWNALEPDKQINPPEKINLIKLITTEPDHPALLKLAETNPEKYKIIMDICFNPNAVLDISEFGFGVIAIPKSVEEIPEYIRDLINYDSMVNYNISNGFILLESLGIYIASDTEQTKYKSNIVEI